MCVGYIVMPNNEAFCEMFLRTSCGRHQFNKKDELSWICIVLSCAWIEEFKRKKQSGICGCLLFFYGNVLVYNLCHSEFWICYKIFCKLIICHCKIYLQLFYHEHILFQQNFHRYVLDLLLRLVLKKMMKY